MENYPNCNHPRVNVGNICPFCLQKGEKGNNRNESNPLNWKEEMISLQRAAIEYGEIYNLFKQKKVGDGYEQTAWSKLAKAAKRFIDSNPPDYML